MEQNKIVVFESKKIRRGLNYVKRGIIWAT